MDAGSVEGDAFKAFEAEGWTRKAQTYDRLTGRATARLVVPLLEAAGVASGTRVLDVACGPGHIVAGAAAKGAEPVGLDAAEGMIAVARARYGEIEFSRETRSGFRSAARASTRWWRGSSSTTSGTRSGRWRSLCASCDAGAGWP